MVGINALWEFGSRNSNLDNYLPDFLTYIFLCFYFVEDDHLSNKEFIAVMKDKMFRGLNKVYF